MKKKNACLVRKIINQRRKITKVILLLNFWYKNIKQQKLNRPKQQQQLSRVFVGYVYAIKKV